MNDLYKLLQVNEYQYKIYIHNEIFNELKQLHSKGSSHVAFTYSFYYLICWLYRYAKYGELNIDTKMIKEILGYNPDNKKVNYLIKQNGVLDELGLTYSSTDYPVAWTFEDDELDFTMLSEMENEIKEFIRKSKGKNYKIKFPVKALWRNNESKEEGLYDGTFYDISYTHEVTFDIFTKCMSNKELGCSAFYLYGYLKYRCGMNGEYNSSIEKIAKEVGMSKNTCDKYLTSLCIKELIECKVNDCIKVDGEFNKKANTYRIIEN